MNEPAILKRFLDILSKYLIISSKMHSAAEGWKLIQQCYHGNYEVLVDVSGSMCTKQNGKQSTTLSPLAIDAITNLITELLTCVHKITLFPFSSTLGNCFSFPGKYSLQDMLNILHNCEHRNSDASILKHKLVNYVKDENTQAYQKKSLFVISALCFDIKGNELLRAMSSANYFVTKRGKLFKLVFIEIALVNTQNHFKKALNRFFKMHSWITYVHKI